VHSPVSPISATLNCWLTADSLPLKRFKSPRSMARGLSALKKNRFGCSRETSRSRSHRR
jgi:hypothetical protein